MGLPAGPSQPLSGAPGVVDGRAVGEARLAGAARSLGRTGRVVFVRALPILRVVTRLGWSVLATGLVAYVLGERLGWPEFLLIAAACLALVALACLFTVGRTVLAVQLDVEPQRLAVGEPATGSLTARNRRARRLLPLQLEVPVGTATARFDLPSLSAGASYEEAFVVPTQRRAVIDVGPVSSVRADPLGLLRRAARWTPVTQIFVHPRVVALDRSSWGFLRDLEGTARDEISMSDLAFHTLRDYSPGDDQRHVHWRSTARTGRLVVRQFNDTRRSHLVVVADSRPTSYPTENDYETALEVVASLAVRNLRDRQATSVLTGGQTVVRGTGSRVLDALARAEPDPAELQRTCDLVSRLAPDVSLAILVTGTAVDVAELRRAARRLPRGTRVLVLRIDPAGAAGWGRVGQDTYVVVPRLDDLPGLLVGVGAGAGTA